MANVKSLVKKQIRLDVVFSIIWARRRNYLIPVGTTLIAFYLLMCCVPRYYSVKVMLAPEYETPSVGGGLSSLASMANINLGSLGGSNDAITPTIYPDLMKSTDFIVPLFDVKVTTSDGKFSGPYSTYLKEGCKAPWWDMAMMYVGSLISSKDEEGGTGEAQHIDPFHLTKKQKEMADAISAGKPAPLTRKRTSSPSPQRRKTHWWPHSLPTPSANACRISSRNIVRTKHASNSTTCTRLSTTLISTT